ncbi:hypothetical protein DFH07DRAFT_748966 [Mycena maculata]|uniref:Glucose-methanol-choline oxidoreductase N-terminal domain-containing protein n=1 Tax=Mycena maculata TaxID=230809 RepID=A0AAD7IKY5_9AGAR|nr:hypothetical protein DFH07DRAFT_748966 [Mycena maculata]
MSFKPTVPGDVRLSSSARASIINQATDLAALNLAFDFIVVGGKSLPSEAKSSTNSFLFQGGTAGNVIVNRSTEDKDSSVLVISMASHTLNIIVPFFCTRATPDSPGDWNYITTPQNGLGGRSIPYPRGFVLGVSSSVNYMDYSCGSKDDYGRFARVTGDEGWSWDRLIPYI